MKGPQRRQSADEADLSVSLRSSPIRETLGIRYLSAEAGKVTGEFSPGPGFTNANGTVQGGILCAFLDHLMGQSGYSEVGSQERLTTVEMSLKFIDPVWPGLLRGEGYVVKKGKTVLFAEGHIFNSEGRIAVKGSTSLFISRP